MNKIKNRWVYLVLCNVTPIVYAVYGNKKTALKYAESLITWRFDRAKERGYEYGYYHRVGESKYETDIGRREKTIFSACLRIKDNWKEYSEDGCSVRVIRRPIIK